MNKEVVKNTKVESKEHTTNEAKKLLHVDVVDKKGGGYHLLFYQYNVEMKGSNL